VQANTRVIGYQKVRSTIAALGKRSCDVQQATFPAFETFETWMVTWLYALFGLGIARFG
jgi:hypothetical protein